MKKFLSIATFIVFITGCGAPGITPEMKDFMAAFGSKEKVKEVSVKYSSSAEIVPEALYLCILGKPNVIKADKKDGRVIYTVETKVESCEDSVTAVGTIRVFKIGWENGKIVSFDWQGPKSGKVEY